MTVRWWMKPVALGIGFATAFLVGEAATRAYFAGVIGPRIFLYGTDWYRNVASGEQVKKWELSEAESQEVKSEWARKDSVEVHAKSLEGYSKFFPNESKTTRDIDTGERIPVTINTHGFRGKDFRTEKSPGIIRVLTLGSSSTFGYYNRDDETYPYQLEKLLNERCRGDIRFEVINFAIPHSSAGNVANMLVAEGIGLSPDAVTFYEGRNDSVLTRKHDGFIDKLHSVMINRLLLVAFLDQLLVGERASITDNTLKLGPHAGERSRVFLGHLTTILNALNASKKNGIYFVAMNQQATSSSPLPLSAPDRLRLRGITYAEEAGKIRSRMERNESVTDFEFSLLVHQQLMEDLKQWAEKQDVTFVDIIGALDQDRHHLLSWVHLHPEANRVVALKLSEVLLRKFCAGPR